eukprot:4849081-Prymnesium_polylepis.1
MSLPPVRAQVLRLKRGRMQRMRDAVFKAVDALAEFVTAHALLIELFKPTFAVRQALALLLARLGKHFFAEGCDVEAPLTEFSALLLLVDLSPLRRRQQRHRVNDVIVPALLDAVAELGLEREHSLGLGEAPPPAAAAAFPSAPPAATSAKAAKAISASEVEDQELVLLDLLAAPAGSFLESLAAVLSRIESIAHVLAWAPYDESEDLSQPTAVAQSDLVIVSLPRLKLTFQSRRVGDVVRLFS